MSNTSVGVSENSAERGGRLTLAVSGMSCGHRVGVVRAALADVDGVTVEQVTVGSATVRYDAARTSPEAVITAAVTDAGYPARRVADA